MNELKAWLAERFYHHRVDGDPLIGSYGVVFILKATEPHVTPDRFAVKTVNPEALTRRLQTEAIRANFERELRTWLHLPTHRNVLPALGLEFAPAPPALTALWPVLPLVRMPYCDGSLLDWVGDDAVSIENKVLAIAQICSGLMWLYEHGIEGHGDLKPENVLRVDFRRQYSHGLEKAGLFPSMAHPWQIRVADLGWANAWAGSGGQDARGWRPYRAPERRYGSFVKEKSDVFALGVIAAELLQGGHPTGESRETVAKWSDSKWERRVEQRDWRLDKVPWADLRTVIEACLHSKPDARPRCSDVLDTAQQTLLRDFGLRTDILAYWTKDSRSSAGNRSASVSAWSAPQLAHISSESMAKEIDAASSRLAGLNLHKPEDVFDWLETTKCLTELYLHRDAEGDRDHAASLAEKVVRLVIDRFDDLDLRKLKGWPLREGPNDLDGFEAWEVLWSYGHTALYNLGQAGSEHARLVDELGDTLAKKQQRHQMTVDEFIERLLSQ